MRKLLSQYTLDHAGPAELLRDLNRGESAGKNDDFNVGSTMVDVIAYYCKGLLR